MAGDDKKKSVWRSFNEDGLSEFYWNLGNLQENLPLPGSDLKSSYKTVVSPRTVEGYGKEFADPNQSREGQSDAKTYEDLGVAAEDRAKAKAKAEVEAVLDPSSSEVPQPTSVESSKAQKTKKQGQAVKKKAAEKKEVEPSEQLNVLFDDQSFLWDHIDAFKNTSDAGPSVSEAKSALAGTSLSDLGDFMGAMDAKVPYSYINFLQISDGEPLTTRNKLFGAGIDALNGATTAQLSSIVPYMKLFKVQPRDTKGKRKRIQFPFNKYTTAESILQSREQRGTDVGFKKVTWAETGTQPGDAGVSFKGTFTLHFQSFEGIFKDRHVDGESIRFADLMQLKSLTKRSAKKPENKSTAVAESAASTNINCNTSDQIHMECGWTLPPDQIAGDPGLAQKLEDLRRTFIITPAMQEIQLTNNGAVDMTIDFNAAIEGKSFGASTDLLNISNAYIDVSTKANLEAQQASIEKNSATKEALDAGHTKSQASKATKEEKESQLKKAKAEYKKVKEDISAAEGNIKSIQYSRLLNVIRNQVSDNGVYGTESRIFHFDLGQDKIERYRRYLQDYANSWADSKKEKEDKEFTKKWLSYLRQKYQREQGGPEFFSSLQGGAATQLTGLQPETAGPSRGGEGSRDRGQVDNWLDGSYRIQYIFLGDIIEAAMRIIYDRPKIKEGKIVGKEVLCPQIRDDVRVVLGSFSYRDTATGKIRNMDLADVPVSFNYFNSWWFNNVVQRNKPVYPLKVFLSDLCGKLLNNVMSPKRYGGMSSGALTVRISPIWLRDKHPLDREWNKNKSKPKKRINLENIPQRGRKGKAQQWTQWLYVYVTGGVSEKSQLNGKFEKDKQRNIPHFFIGGDTGVIKDIKFSKTKIKHHDAQVIASNMAAGLQSDSLFFADIYNAEIKILGNPVFTQEMLVYIDPRAMGLGLTDIDPRAFMHELGIGGYYRIYAIRHTLDSSGFNTSLSTIVEQDMRNLNKRKNDR